MKRRHGWFDAMRGLLMVGLLLGAVAAWAAPQKLVLVYQATRNGQPFATVTETFQQSGQHYQLESLTEGIGVYALFGKRRLVSEGEVTPEGLRPTRFEQQQGDQPKKAVRADFDWNAGTLAMTAKGKTSVEALAPGTQDLASFAYQFMFVPPQGDEIALPVTTGKKLRNYRYRIVTRDDVQETPAGKFQTVHLRNAAEGSEAKQIWLGREAHHIPVRIITPDDNGALIEQVLARMHVE